MSQTPFINRHIDTNEVFTNDMLKTIGVKNAEELIANTIPSNIRLKAAPELPEPMSEVQFLNDFRQMMSQNKLYKSYIGQGYYPNITPPVILRNIFENPGWYTAYTPYQAEIAQGRLEALINYQTMICDLTGFEIANASLLDEATAAAEAMTMLYAVRNADKQDSKKFLVSNNTFTQTIDVLKTRAEPLGLIIEVTDLFQANLTDQDIFGALYQYPDAQGAVLNYSKWIAEAKKNNISVACATDLMALTHIIPPGELGADVAIGSSQRFGVPLGMGGPHSAFFATKEEYKRHIPGRLIGVSVDKHGNNCYRMSLQMREQHIKRDKATSNICTAQVLLGVIASMYAVYHGPKGLRSIANHIHTHAHTLYQALIQLGLNPIHDKYFDTLCIGNVDIIKIREIAEAKCINLYYGNNVVQISVDETSTTTDILNLINIFEIYSGKLYESKNTLAATLPLQNHIRTSTWLTHPVFNSYHTEHELLRYMKTLENKDLSMVHSMIPLGSCTMKLNATAEMIPVTWAEVGQIHPFVPKWQISGYLQMFEKLEKYLANITGFAATSLQPNSGAQGEYAGLIVIREYHKHHRQEHRNVALIPQSAHGTNPASAVMAGMKVVVVQCDDRGNIDVQDLKNKALLHDKNLACLMVTYPSTHGVFEKTITDICSTVHECGGLVYMDGANMNAQVALTSPAAIGADVCHLNLHKTFCIPHGGGGPGMGPICVAEHLVPFLPNHSITNIGTEANRAVSAAPWGSASILPISYAYIRMMGGEGLKMATTHAIINANYIKSRLQEHYDILYTGENGFCAHEFILDCRAYKNTAGVEVEDIAKRLMDYGFHAPTVSFPVPGTLMIEPTESESKPELDRFCDAMIAIRNEIKEIETGVFGKVNNVLKNAPHTAQIVTSDHWDYPYPRHKAAFPLEYVKNSKFWPSVSRIDNAHGDRNLICTCIPVAQYEV
ncbi:MAG: aminomethyl-transferring glycine dehydrogenase [Cytophagales bacterium]|nr:aminomethyl-transferring glycine dehydrogenase [Cytophagales bacterium]